MCSKSVLLLSLFLFTITFSAESYGNFVVVSTTQLPSQHQNSNSDEATELRELKATVNEANHRLEMFQIQINQIQKLLESYSKENQMSKVQTALHKNNDQLKLLELKINQQSLQTSLKINELRTEIKEIFHRLETLDLKITNPPRSCKEVRERGHNVSDIYFIQPTTAPRSFMVLCDMDTRGGGWTYILNRYDGSQDFYLNWKNYSEGFGSLAKEFWLGLENIHHLTGYETNELLIELMDWDEEKRYARYNSFVIGNEKEGYALKLIEGYTGDAGDNFGHDNGMKFSTFDKDQDIWTANCAVDHQAAWWYRQCGYCQLTGKYLGKIVTSKQKNKGIYWWKFHGNQYSLKQARMMIRPRDHSKPMSLPSKF